jgi:predicted nucleotidyltransferase
LTERARLEGLSLNEYCIRRLATVDGLGALPVDAPAILERAHAAVDGDGVLGLVVHGSVARGEASTSSDVDLLIVVDDTVALTRALYRRWDDGAPLRAERPIDLHFVHLPPTPERAGSVWCEAAIEGIVLADASGRIWRTLRDLRRAISEGRLVRRSVHGQPYWTAA